MSGIRFLYRVHREDPDGIDAEEIEVAWRGNRRRCGALSGGGFHAGEDTQAPGGQWIAPRQKTHGAGFGESKPAP
jgi:hypothetical protein